MTCQEVDELTPAFAAGALTPEEHRRVREHLDGCPRHHLALAEMRAAVGALQLSPEDIDPPANLRTRILEAAEGEAAAAPPAAAPASPGRPRRSFGLPALRPAIVLAGALVVALVGWNLALQFGGDEADAYVRYMGNGGTVHGSVYFVENVGVVTVEGLAPLQGSEDYQVWARKGGETVSLGLLNTSATGDGYVLLSDHVSESAPVFITIEPSGGAGQPSGKTVLTTDP